MNNNNSDKSSTSGGDTASDSDNASAGDNDYIDEQFVITQCRRTPSVFQDQEEEEVTDESNDDERLMAVYCRAGKLGAAYYTLQTGELQILEEIVDRPPEFQMLHNLYRQVLPVKLLFDGKTQGTFVRAVKKMVFENDARCELVFISSKDYNFEACKRRIYSLALPYEPPGCTDEDRTIFLRTIIDFSQEQSIHALGAVLRYLDLNWSNLNMEFQTKPQFLSLRKISLADIVTIDEDTYRGLQIFTTVSHPSNFKKGVHGSNKEGLSMFHAFSKCSSKVGQTRMRMLLQHPSTDIETLRRRQDVVGFFMQPQNDGLMRNICSSLRYIKNVNGILSKINALSAKPYEWKSLYNTLYNAVLICEMCENTKNIQYLEELTDLNNKKLYEMALIMNTIIDFDLSKSEGKFTVKAGVDSELDIKKQTMAHLQQLMSETAKVELDRLPEWIEECSMVYMPHLGYLVAVKAWAPELTNQQKELPNMKFMFQNYDYIHYKSKGCEELDVIVGDTYPEIVAHETRIMMKLTTEVLEHLHTLADLINKCAELDCLIAISKVSKEYNFIRPVLSEEKVISIKQGKHPLFMMSCDHFVPNDAESTHDEGFVKILTGLNSSGKSVYMKQIALIVYLAHIGSFVPAESATIGIVQHLYSRIQSTECVATHMSAFLIDLKQMALVLQEATSDSLIIIDEFGKGTTEVDGMALLAACLNTLLSRAEGCPHVYLSTHLSIKEYTLDTPMLKFLTFEHVIEEDELVFLYRVREGCAGCGAAQRVATLCGVSDVTLRRAAAVMNVLVNNEVPEPDEMITNKLKSFTEMAKFALYQCLINNEIKNIYNIRSSQHS